MKNGRRGNPPRPFDFSLILCVCLAFLALSQCNYCNKSTSHDGYAGKQRQSSPVGTTPSLVSVNTTSSRILRTRFPAIFVLLLHRSIVLLMEPSALYVYSVVFAAVTTSVSYFAASLTGVFRASAASTQSSDTVNMPLFGFCAVLVYP